MSRPAAAAMMAPDVAVLREGREDPLGRQRKHELARLVMGQRVVRADPPRGHHLEPVRLRDLIRPGRRDEEARVVADRPLLRRDPVRPVARPGRIASVRSRSARNRPNAALSSRQRVRRASASSSDVARAGRPSAPYARSIPASSNSSRSAATQNPIARSGGWTSRRRCAASSRPSPRHRASMPGAASARSTRPPGNAKAPGEKRLFGCRWRRSTSRPPERRARG